MFSFGFIFDSREQTFGTIFLLPYVHDKLYCMKSPMFKTLKWIGFLFAMSYMSWALQRPRQVTFGFLMVPLHSYFEEKRKRVGSKHWINRKTLKMQRFCTSYISKNWKFLIFFKFFKCTYTIFNNSRNISHQNGSESCPKSTKNSQTKGFPQSDTTTFRG